MRLAFPALLCAVSAAVWLAASGSAVAAKYTSCPVDVGHCFDWGECNVYPQKYTRGECISFDPCYEGCSKRPHAGGLFGGLGDCPDLCLDESIKKDRPDSHIPAGLMGDHVHKKGEWMFEYKFIQMSMEDNQQGKNRVSDVAALDAAGFSFAVTPTQMNMDMHMLHIMYGVGDNLTAYIMPMYLSNTMDHIRRVGPPFRTHNDGWGDLPFGFLWRTNVTEHYHLVWNFGMAAPTGDIDNLVMPGGPEFPYPMRLGTGSFQFRPGLTYLQFAEEGTLGMQFQSDLPVGRNDQDYRVGNSYRFNNWLSWRCGCEGELSLSFRVENLWRENYSGADPDLDPLFVSTNRTDMRGGYWLNFGYGAIWMLPDKSRLSFEWLLPVYQNLDGVQLQTDWVLFASWSKGFG